MLNTALLTKEAWACIIWFKPKQIFPERMTNTNKLHISMKYLFQENYWMTRRFWSGCWSTWSQPRSRRCPTPCWAGWSETPGTSWWSSVSISPTPSSPSPTPAISSKTTGRMTLRNTCRHKLSEEWLQRHESSLGSQQQTTTTNSLPSQQQFISSVLWYFPPLQWAPTPNSMSEK